MLVDTHCHLYLKEFDADREAVIQRAAQAGVQKMYLPAINSQTHESMLLLEKQFPQSCFSMMGLHPCYVKDDFENELIKVEEWLKKRSFAAIGECGLDFYWDKTYVEQQYEALQQQINWAVTYQLPLVLHTRNATKETIAVIRKNIGSGIKGIFHCFGGTLQEAKEIIALGFYLGIGGVVTYKNAGLDEVIKQVDLEHLVLETDAPYLSPVPFRGKRNESSYLLPVAEKIAAIKNITLEEVASVTANNAEIIFSRLNIKHQKNQ